MPSDGPAGAGVDNPLDRLDRTAVPGTVQGVHPIDPFPAPAVPPCRKRVRRPFSLAFAAAAVLAVMVVLGPGQQPTGLGLIMPGRTFDLRSATRGDLPHPARPGEGEFLLTTVAVYELTHNSKFWYTFIGRDDEFVEIEPDRFGALPVDSGRADFADSQITAALLATEYLGRGRDLYLEPSGVYVVEVYDGPLLRAGAEPGDVIVAVGKAAVRDTDELVAALGKAGEVFTMTLERDGAPFDVTVRRDPGGRIGAGVDTNWELRIGVGVELDSVSGASGGVMFALTFLDLLTEGDLTAGSRIAGSGTVSFTGAVGEVRGVVEKMRGAVRDGAEVFLLPAELAHLADLAPSGLEVVTVASFAEAVELLCSRPGVADGACSR